MTSAATRVPRVVRDIRPSLVATKHRETLLGKQNRPRRDWFERRQVWQRTEQRAPTEIGARQTGCRSVALDVGRRRASTGIAAWNVVTIDPIERPDESRVLLPGQSKLRVLGDAPLP